MPDAELSTGLFRPLRPLKASKGGVVVSANLPLRGGDLSVLEGGWVDAVDTTQLAQGGQSSQSHKFVLDVLGLSTALSGSVVSLVI